MARQILPDPLKRRHVLAGELDATRGRAIAEAYLDEGRTLEAVAFFEKIGAQDALNVLCERAVEEGDVFLLREASAAMKREIDAAMWARVADAAAAGGKDQYAEEARRQGARLEERGS